MVDDGVIVIDKNRKGALVLRIALRAVLPEDKTVFDGLHGVAFVADRYKIFGVVGKNHIQSPAGRVFEGIFQRPGWEAGVVRVPGNEWAPPGDHGFEGNIGIGESNHTEGKACQKLRLLEPRQPVACPAGAVPCSRPSECFPFGNRSLQDSGGVAVFTLDADRSEGTGFVEEFHLVSHGHMGDGSPSFETDHSRADAADGPSHSCIEGVRVGPVVGAAGGFRHRGCAAYKNGYQKRGDQE